MPGDADVNRIAQFVKLCNEAKTRALLQGGWRRYNIFEGLSRSEIGIAVTLGTLSAVVVALILTAF